MTTLQTGSSGPDVQALQQTLSDLGFDPNGIDGKFGPGTKAAVIAFQQSKGLQADGKVGPATMAARVAAGGPAVGAAPPASAAATAPASGPGLDVGPLAGIVPA